jgi:hypothetical protein
MTPASLVILQNGQEVGPFPAEAVREMLAAGSLSPQDFAWAEGMPEWVPLEALFPGVEAAVAPAPAPVAATPLPGVASERSFASFVGDAFSYPFRGDGLIILLTGTVVFTVLESAAKFGSFGLFGLALSIGMWGYLLLMLQSVIHGTAQGEDTLPRWPSMTDKGELVEKWFQWLATVALCFAPAFAVLKIAEANHREIPDSDLLLAGGLGFAGALYFPMAALGVAMFDSLAALNPLLVFRAIFAVPAHYLLTLVVFAGLIAVQALTGELANAVPYLGALVDQFDALWSAFFLSRVLGGLYYVNRRKLGWF